MCKFEYDELIRFVDDLFIQIENMILLNWSYLFSKQSQLFSLNMNEI
jgi:hypothetical protein